MSSKNSKVEQIAALADKLSVAQIDEAKSLAANKSNVVRLAFKLLTPVTVDTGGLTKSQYEIYIDLLKDNKQVAENWRTKRLADNVAKKAAKAAKQPTTKKGKASTAVA